MELRPIKTESDYQNALKEIERLFDAEPESPQCERLDILTTLVEAYEREHYPIDPPDAISAILYYLEARGLSEKDLTALIGSQEQVSAILNKQQPLNLEMSRRLNQDLGIPAEVLIKPYLLLKASA